MSTSTVSESNQNAMDGLGVNLKRNTAGLTYGECITLGIEARIAELLDDALYIAVEFGEQFTNAIAAIREEDDAVDEAIACGDWKSLRRSKTGREVIALYRARAQWREDNGHMDGDLESQTDVAVWGGTQYIPATVAAHRDLYGTDGEFIHRLVVDPELAERYGTMHAVGTETVMPNRVAISIRERMHDDEFAYVHRIEDDLEACAVSRRVLREDPVTGNESDVDESQWDTWEQQDVWAREAADQARSDLIALLRERGVDPSATRVKWWIIKRCQAKAGMRFSDPTHYLRHNRSGDARTMYCHRIRLKAYRSCIAIIRRGYHTGFAYDGGPTPTR